MKHLKTYEGFFSRFRKDKSEPQVGDYVLCYSEVADIEENREFIENNIGYLSRIIKKKKLISSPYVVKYDIPDDEEDLKNEFEFYIKGEKTIEDGWLFKRHEILHFGTKEDMETILTAKKYNL